MTAVTEEADFAVTVLTLVYWYAVLAVLVAERKIGIVEAAQVQSALTLVVALGAAACFSTVRVGAVTVRVEVVLVLEQVSTLH